MTRTRRSAATGAGVALVMALGACTVHEAGGEPSVTTPRATGSGTTSTASQSVALSRDSDVDAVVEVRGHKLAVQCRGSGAPTVVVLHGWIDFPNITTTDEYYGRLRDQMVPTFRFCTYDRANVGLSEPVDGTQTPDMVVGDLHDLMTSIGDPGPYLLIGQSAGGMVASAYAVAHPQSIFGIVMVDASFDEEVTIEDVGMVPAGISPCEPKNREIDGLHSLQMIDSCAMYRYAYDRRAQRPKVPLVYLAAKKEPWTSQTEFGAEWVRKIVGLQRSYAASWSPGRFQWVDSGHDIHDERPAAVADAVRWVVSHRRGQRPPPPPRALTGRMDP